MPRPTEEAVASIVSASYAAVRGACDWWEAAAALAGIAGAERVTLNMPNADGSVAAISWPHAPEGELEYIRDYAVRDLRVRRVIAGRRGVLATEDLMSPDEVAACPVHQQYYRRWPECWHTLFAAVDHDGLLLAPTLHRGARLGQFDEELRRVLGAVAGHLVRAAYLQKLLGSVDAADGCLAALDAPPEAMIMIDPLGRVAFANGSAKRMLSGRDVIALRNGAVIGRGAGAAALDRAVACALIGARTGLAPAGDMSAVLPRPPRPPLLASAYPVGGSRRPAVVLRLRDPLTLDDPTIETVRSALGLTTAEARLALAVSRGVDVAEHAAAEGVSEHTARTHMRNLRGKLGVRRQTEVVRAVLRLSS